MSSISDIRLETHLGKESTSSNNSNFGSRGALAWTPPASMEGSTPTWTEGTPSFTESSSSENGEIGLYNPTFACITIFQFSQIFYNIYFV